MKVIIAGGRDFTDAKLAYSCIREHVSPNDTIISGHARGADEIGERYAHDNSLPLEIYPADWNRYGRSAGYIRNAVMAEAADKLIAFWDGRSRGTKNMIETAKKQSLEVIVFDYIGNKIEV